MYTLTVTTTDWLRDAWFMFVSYELSPPEMFPTCYGYEASFIVETLTWHYYHRMQCGKRHSKQWRNVAFISQFNFLTALVQKDAKTLRALISQQGLDTIVLDRPDICVKYIDEGLRSVMRYSFMKRWKVLRILRKVLKTEVACHGTCAYF